MSLTGVNKSPFHASLDTLLTAIIRSPERTVRHLQQDLVLADRVMVVVVVVVMVVMVMGTGHVTVQLVALDHLRFFAWGEKVLEVFCR